MAKKEHHFHPNPDTVIVLTESLTQFAVWEVESPQPCDEESIYYRVSSRHLMGASAHFRRMMSGGEWKEGICEEDGLFYIYTKEWDAEAFLILMNVLHLRNRQVPRSVSLEMLTKIAVLVDFYECWEAVDMWGSTWANGIKYSEPVPLTYGRELIMWICVARVFGLVAEFKQATQTAIKQSHESIQISGLPIYPNIVAEIDRKRYQALESIVSSLYDLLDKYRNERYTCSQDSSKSSICGSVFLGTLTRHMDSKNLLSPRPEVPFPGLSVERMCQRLRHVKSPTWYDERGTTPRKYTRSHTCSLNTTVVASLNSVVDRIQGLRLGDFQKAANDMENGQWQGVERLG